MDLAHSKTWNGATISHSCATNRASNPGYPDSLGTGWGQEPREKSSLPAASRSSGRIVRGLARHVDVLDSNSFLKRIAHGTTDPLLHEGRPSPPRTGPLTGESPADPGDAELAAFDGYGAITRPRVGLERERRLDVVQGNAQDSRCVPQRDNRSEAEAGDRQRIKGFGPSPSLREPGAHRQSRSEPRRS